jgi:hypothetical protein
MLVPLVDTIENADGQEGGRAFLDFGQIVYALKVIDHWFL